MPHLLRCAILLMLCAGTAVAQDAIHSAAPDRVAFGLDWKAEAEYGIYYRRLVTGIYARHGLDVWIRQGGPQVNQAQLPLARRLDMTSGSNSHLLLSMVQEKLPLIAVATFS